MIAEIERLPDIDFVSGVTLDSIEAEMEADYKSKYREITGAQTTLLPGAPMTLLMYACAVQLLHMYEVVNFAGRQNFIKYATGDYLDNLAAFKSVERQAAFSAVCTVRFTLSAIRATAVAIPQGTRVTDTNANVYFATTEYAEIPAGSEYVDIICECLTPGAIGNDFAAGTLTVIVDPVAYVASCTNLTAGNGGIDRESDESLRDRFYLAPANWSVAGPEAAYIYFVKTAYSGVSDVRVTSPSATYVDIRVVGENGTALSAEVCQMIEDYLEDMGVRPQTDQVSVSSPTQVYYNVELTYYINRSDIMSAETIKARVNEAVSAYTQWQSSRIGRDIEPGKLTELVMAAGAKRVSITYPAYTQVADTAIPALGTKTVTYGGLEND